MSSQCRQLSREGWAARDRAGVALRRAERGTLLIFCAIFALLMIAILGIAADSARILTTAQQLQHAADAASLAGARLVKWESDPSDPDNTFQATRQAVYDTAVANVAAGAGVELRLNEGNDPAGDIVIGSWDPDDKTFTPNLLTPNAVFVRALKTSTSLNQQLPLIFGSAFGFAKSDVGVGAIAVLAPAQQALIIVLDLEKEGALKLNGTVEMVVNGKVHVNSNAPCGVTLNGSVPKLFAYETSVVGGACWVQEAMQSPVVEGADVLPDPLAHLLPTVADWTTYRSTLALPEGPAGAIDGSKTSYPPGYYPKGLELESDEFVLLADGPYMFGPPGIVLHGSSYVTADNATLFIDEGATVQISGNGAGMKIVAPEGGDFEGVALFHHRKNTDEPGNIGPGDSSPDPEAFIAGGGDFTIEGVLYVPSGELVMGGSPGKEIGAIVVNTLSNAGTTGFTITGKGIPPAEGPEYTYLVQ